MARDREVWEEGMARDREVWEEGRIGIDGQIPAT
jgi:hypothetical protein